jgi:hypothetical protein
LGFPLGLGCWHYVDLVVFVAGRLDLFVSGHICLTLSESWGQASGFIQVFIICCVSCSVARMAEGPLVA